MIDVLKTLHKLGLDKTEPVNVKGLQVSPRDVVVPRSSMPYRSWSCSAVSTPHPGDSPSCQNLVEIWKSGPMPTVNLSRVSQHHFEATNARGGTVSFGRKWAGEFTPVELLLVAIAGCASMDVDAITVKRSEPTRFNVSCSGNSTKSAHGNHVTDIQVDFDVEFPDSEGGRAAIGVLDKAIRKSHDRLCTVTRTVELGTPVDALLRGESVLTAGFPA